MSQLSRSVVSVLVVGVVRVWSSCLCCVFLKKVSSRLSLRHQLLNRSRTLAGHAHNLSLAASGANSSYESQLLGEFNLILMKIRSLCSELLAANSNGSSDLSDLAEECGELVGPEESRYTPVVSPDIGDLGGRGTSGRTHLQDMLELLDDMDFSEEPTIDLRPEYFGSLV